MYRQYGVKHGRNATNRQAGHVVLILDDDALHLDMLAERIEAEGYRVAQALTPGEAWRLSARLTSRFWITTFRACRRMST